ncbi:fatty acid hydroxylase [Sphingorhabdus lutea]|uniref:Fatty acid hydroxylase n=1 Tax=Sphingorhabdus lutea TaxID=1913578 RepID=A0A1L3J9H1_9SPHN|nr:sterol desaturase family protein [Sphingorhabdus lutea]APG61777.1 fatty acid hydroxylase [Sphingorhabdus lutea]
MNKAESNMKSEGGSFWTKSHYLDRMNLKQLIIAYFQHYTIIAYLLLTALSIGVFIYYPAQILPTSLSILAALVVYPLVWHLLHQYVLHGQWMYKFKFMSATWKRIHYDHHQDPNHLEVLFGALHTTLPTIAVATLPIGFALGGIGGAAAAFAAGLLITCYYEFIHCIQHLAFKPKYQWVAFMKQRHLEHHFHDEDGNYGITNYFWDRVLGTYYERKDRKDRSPTVFNLGYTEEVAKDYPWVKEMSGGIASGHPRRRSLEDNKKSS